MITSRKKTLLGVLIPNTAGCDKHSDTTLLGSGQRSHLTLLGVANTQTEIQLLKLKMSVFDYGRLQMVLFYILSRRS